MYCSKYLLNRQKIINPVEIYKALGNYFEYLPEYKRKFIYKMDWFHMGISIPVTVYSKEQPLMQVFKECQMYSLVKLPELPPNESEVKFSIFAVPSKSNKEYDEEQLEKWFLKKIEGCAEIVSIEFGPHNCLYYEKNDGMQNIQTYTLKGKLKIKDKEKLELLRSKAIGFYSEFGCGLLGINF